jgi:hypothetical protein
MQNFNFITTQWSRQPEDRGFTYKPCKIGTSLGRCSHSTLKYLLSKATSTFLKSLLIAEAYSNPTTHATDKSSLPIISQNRIPNLPMPSLPVVPCPYPAFFFRQGKLGNPSSDPKISNSVSHFSRKRFCSSVSIHQPDLPTLKINLELPLKRLLSQFPLII